jgi:hypothetical protein
LTGWRDGVNLSWALAACNACGVMLLAGAVLAGTALVGAALIGAALVGAARAGTLANDAAAELTEG